MIHQEILEKIDSLPISKKLKDIFKKTLEKNIKDKNGKPLTLDGLILIRSNDPTSDFKYQRWMLDVFKNTDSEIFYEDLFKFNESLEIFEKVKHKLKIEERNILNYNTINDLWNKVKKYKENKESALSKKQLRGDSKVKGEYDILLENKEYMVVVPRTYRSSCYWGSGTRWCTAGPSIKTYESYAHEGPLVIIHYNDGDVSKNIQFHIESLQYMDYEDRPIDAEHLFTKYPDVLDAFIKYVEKDGYTCPNKPNLAFYQKYFLNSLEKGKSNLARVYLAYGADVNGIVADCVYGIPICKAVYLSDEKEALKSVKMLLKYGAKLELNDKFIDLAHMVASTGNIKVLHLLVKNGLNIYVNDFLGRNPLHYAFMLGKVDMARELIDLGLDVNKIDMYGKTPLDLAKDVRDNLVEKRV